MPGSWIEVTVTKPVSFSARNAKRWRCGREPQDELIYTGGSSIMPLVTGTWQMIIQWKRGYWQGV